MSKSSRAVLIAAIAAVVQPCLAVEPGPNWHGRAGQLVGAERVHAISARSGAASFWQQVALVDRPGRAGGPIAQLPPLSLPRSQPVAVARWYGRAGGPLYGLH
jgi:hypothetical protein